MESRPHSPVPASQVPCIPTHSSSTPTALRCCCGRNDCTFLQHNNLALEGLEKDLATAARLGQVRSFVGALGRNQASASSFRYL